MRHSLPLFVYGSLRDPALRTVVIGRALASDDVSAACLEGHRLFRVRGRSYPMIADAPMGVVKGLLLSGLTPLELRLLDAFEGNEYRRGSVDVHVSGREFAALVYWPRQRLRRDRRPWRLERWPERERRRMLARARIWRKSGRWGNGEMTEV